MFKYDCVNIINTNAQPTFSIIRFFMTANLAQSSDYQGNYYCYV